MARCRTTSDAPVDGSPAQRLSTCSPAALRALAAARISITANGGTWALAATFMGPSWRTDPAAAPGPSARRSAVVDDRRPRCVGLDAVDSALRGRLRRVALAA